METSSSNKMWSGNSYKPRNWPSTALQKNMHHFQDQTDPSQGKYSARKMIFSKCMPSLLTWLWMNLLLHLQRPNMATVGALNLFAQISNNAYQALFQGFSRLAGIHGFLLFRHQFPDVAWRGWSSSLWHGPGPVVSIPEWRCPYLCWSAWNQWGGCLDPLWWAMWWCPLLGPARWSPPRGQCTGPSKGQLARSRPACWTKQKPPPHCSSKRLYTSTSLIPSWSTETRVSPFWLMTEQ